MCTCIVIYMYMYMYFCCCRNMQLQSWYYYNIRLHKHTHTHTHTLRATFSPLLSLEPGSTHLLKLLTYLLLPLWKTSSERGSFITMTRRSLMSLNRYVCVCVCTYVIRMCACSQTPKHCYLLNIKIA